MSTVFQKWFGQQQATAKTTQSTQAPANTQTAPTLQNRQPAQQTQQNNTASTSLDSVMRNTQQARGTETNPTAATNPNNSDTVAQNNSQSPLDMFTSIWQTKPADQNAQNSNQIFRPDQAKLKEAVGKMNFVDGLDQAAVTKALSGDVQSFMSILNSVAQTGFAHALNGSSELVQAGFNNQMPKIQKDAEALYRRQRTSDLLSADNPAFNHPSVKPMFDMMRDKIANQFPDAGPDEVSQMTREYFGEFAKLFNGGNSQETQAANANKAAEEEGQRWVDFFSKG